MRNFQRLFIAALVALITTAPATAQIKGSGKLGVDVAGMDRSTRPQDDFFRYVNGTWVDKTEIPADQTRWGSFNNLRDEAAAALQSIIETVASRQNTTGSNEQKVADYYRSFMDTARIEALGLKPLESDLARIRSMKSHAELPAMFARGSRIGTRAPFSGSVGQDAKNSAVYAVSLGQSGLGMPDRDYYLKSDAKFADIRKEYASYIVKLFTLAGQPDPQGAAQRIIALETMIAEKQWDRVRQRDRNATYNKMTVAQLSATAPAFDWSGFLKELGGKDVTEVIVRQTDYMPAAAELINATPIETWKEYLTFSLLSTYADELPRAFVEAKFDFTGRVLTGLPALRSRGKRGVTAVEGALGEPLGRLYVEKHFTPAAKARMDELVRNVLAAFREGINELAWMSPATKAEAQAKLAKFKVKIGYPERWRDYSGLEVRSDDLIGNVMRSRAFQNAESWGRLGKPVERWRMGMTPQTVNASYSPVNNEITFPAGILQPPFFNPEADDAVNYGAIGAVIGHEISHGFDDQGRKSDGDGNLRDWWTAEDAKAFDTRASRLGAQYDAQEPIPGMRVNGKLTMGENIGDLSGLAVAYRAYRISLGGKHAPVIDGFTGDQRFLLGFGQIWRGKAREEYRRNQLMTDPHSPEMYRATIPLMNFDPFYAAFDVKPGDKMYLPADARVKIW